MDYNGPCCWGCCVCCLHCCRVVCVCHLECSANVRHAVKQFICRQFSYDYKQFPLFSLRLAGNIYGSQLAGREAAMIFIALSGFKGRVAQAGDADCAPCPLLPCELQSKKFATSKSFHKYIC